VIPEAFKLLMMQLAMLLADICNTLTLDLPFPVKRQNPTSSTPNKESCKTAEG
jgi:hypothetical protein